MASYDLTPRIAPNLDRHLVFPLLEFLQERQLHPDEQILKAKIELLNKTNMVDYAMDIHKNLYHTDDVPQDMLERRAEVVARLKYLEDDAAPLVDFLQNPNAVQELRADKHYNLQMLNDRYQIGPDQIEALYRYAKFQFECGNYSGAADYLHQYRALCTNSERSLSALWGKLAAEILMQNWDIALDELNRVKEIIDSKSFSSPLNQVQNRIWLMHRSLFIFFNHDNGRTQIIDLFYQDKYLKAIQTSAPHLLRYLATAFIVNKRRRPQFKDFIKVIQQEQCSYKDPITEFLVCVYVNYDFDGAQKKMKECEEVILNDPFLGKRVEEGNFSTVLLIDEFLENARLFIFETSCRIHQHIDMGRLTYTNHLDKEVTQEISLTHSEASVSNPHEFKRALESVEIPASQSVLNLIEGHANPSPSIVVDKARRQIPKTIRPIVPKVSSFSADQVIYDCQAKLVMTLWQSIQSKLARTPFNQLSSIESEVQKILCAMEEMKSVDSSSLRNMVQEYFDHVKSFSDLEYSFSSRLSTEDKTKKLQALEVRLRESNALQGNLLSELGEFEKELKDLESHKKHLESFIQEREEALKKTIADTSQIRDKMTSIESIPILSEGEVKSLGILQSTLESSRDELKNYKWKA